MKSFLTIATWPLKSKIGLAATEGRPRSAAPTNGFYIQLFPRNYCLEAAHSSGRMNESRLSCNEA